MTLPPCPFLPVPAPGLDWRFLNAHRDTARGGEFYRDCLVYGQDLWLRGLAARSLLCLDRAFGADLKGDESELSLHPLPYAATAWILLNVPDGVFIGNPRVHFQHYAGRMNPPRLEQRRARAWACWALARAVQPSWPADVRHIIAEPDQAQIADELGRHGLPGEAGLWMGVLGTIAAR